MSTKVAQMTTDELRELIGSVVEQKLVEVLGHSYSDLDLPLFLRNRLLHKEQGMTQDEEDKISENVAVKPSATIITLASLLAEVTDDNLHLAIDTGPAVGVEVW